MADPTIKQGSKGPAVTKAQRALNDRGYTAGVADGIFGSQTKNAVSAYVRIIDHQPLAAA